MNEDHEVFIAPGSGFCKGVAFAVQKALDVAKNKKEGSVFLDGELVHNRAVGERLYAQGIRPLQRNSKIHGGDTILIRAHGISPKRRLFLEHFGCKIEDCTCPLVRKISRIMEANRHRQIILLGDRNHPEIEGLCGYAENIRVCENLKELSQLIAEVCQNKKTDKNFLDNKNFKGTENWIMLCQSTLDMDFLEAAKNLCGEKNFSVEIFDTICSATKRRQSGLEVLKDCDAVIVVGGFHSANTKRLFEKMKRQVAAVFWIEKVGDLAPINWRIYPKIGIAAGASTPQSAMENIYGEISKKIA
ncbi:MAG: 4-hydroxy-3-methylbut-2-enyl diphosphate reductase [Puniceicoccales bacterium]|jgi:4-hydroxy-3-methylbut-2-enyl diphosphate reductase|nr:4-hydroxy-3-methylbut-2-enyl diphosphate reductase [Puniceicoccales bacterium]